MRIADNILVMPLHGIDPALEIKAVLDGVFGIGIMDGRIDVICQMVVADCPIENLICLLGKRHINCFIPQNYRNFFK